MKKIILLLCFSLSRNIFIDAKQSQSNVKVVCSAVLIDSQYEMRKQEYIHSLKILRSFGFDPYVIESHTSGRTFLDEYSQHVIYTQTNDLRIQNKGVNEAMALKEGLKNSIFHSEDMIVKLTGRYYLKSDAFLREIENSPDIDVFIKIADNLNVVIGCFAMRCKYLKRFFEWLNFHEMELHKINIEYCMIQYVNKLWQQGVKIKFLDNLGLVANIFGMGKTELTYW